MYEPVSCIGTRPGEESVQGIFREISEMPDLSSYVAESGRFIAPGACVRSPATTRGRPA